MARPVFRNIRSINGKFLLMVVPPVIAITVSLIALNGLFAYRDMQKEYSIALANFTEIQGAALASDIWNYDDQGLMDILDAIQLYPGISGVVVRNDRGQILAQVENHRSAEIAGALNRLEYPISYRNPYRDQRIGTLTIFYHFDPIRSRLKKRFFRDSVILSVFVLLVVVGAVVANRLIIGIPLQRLVSSVLKKDLENIHEPVDWPALDEMGTSIAAYNDLLAKLTEKEQGLKQSEERLKAALEKLRERERALSTLLGNLPGMAYRCLNDEDWTMRLVSEGCLPLTGYPSHSLVNNAEISYNDLIHPGDRDVVRQQVWEALEERRPFQISYRILTKNRGERWVWEKGVGIFASDGEVTALEGFVNDITELKNAEGSLKKAREAAETSRMEAEAANRAKSAFLANMSHELRTPMNAILGFSQLMFHDPGLSEENRENLDIVRRSGEHLLKLINNVLVMSKIESGKMQLQETSFDLFRMLDDIEKMLKIKAKKKGLPLSFERGPEVPRYIRSDEIKLRQVLINLIGNAVKFTAKGEVNVRAKALGTEKPDIEILTDPVRLFFQVEDTGPGISPEETGLLFEAFGQTQAGLKCMEGTGLGLAISRKFVRLMGGDIGVESQEGKGSVFSFHIGAHIVDSQSLECPAPLRRIVGIEPGQPRLKMLIVDDNAVGRRLLSKMLSPYGFELMEALDGNEAVRTWKERRPDLVWMDMKMPVAGGRKAVKAMREWEERRPDLPKTVIVAQTASSFEEDREKALEAGCDDFLRKPFQEAEVLEIIQRHTDMRFAYEDQDTENGEKESSGDEDTGTEPAILSSLSPGILHRLKQAAADADFQKVETLIDEIERRDAGCGKYFARLASDFQYKEIVEIIDKLPVTSS